MPKIRFSKTDAAVLQRIRRIEKLGDEGARFILGASVVDLLLAMGNPVEFTVTFANSDFDSMAKGAMNIQKIAACASAEIILLHLEVGPNSPTDDAKDYFERLLDQVNKRCESS
ncbi:hypothetical protein [Polaromonas sp. JS666]|uniref:hypothetical protein n=1 Tax=Polaromonas sp. (strain JS666 / ATCC BAA-500) TaxID=296591 RepID=UPI0000537924|nr:hypothetical protein [Polaromonas sp. JS666]ABE46845.1 hypothetical protein Bpro_4973 [Polaromonas sp. JS666]